MKHSIKDNNKAFFAFSVCIFSLILLFLTLIEYETLHSIFLCSQLEEEYQGKLEKGELLENILKLECKNMEDFLRKNPEKTIFDYITRTVKGELLIELKKGKFSEGNYSIEIDLPKWVQGNSYKVYYLKYYRIAEYNHQYKIQLSIEYQYGENKGIHHFISQKIVEMRIYLE